MWFYTYDPYGKLSKITSYIPTVFYDEVKEIESYIEERNIQTEKNLFIPSASYFLKDYKDEFVIKYWLKTDKGICLFYNEEKKSCHIYPVRPLVCRIHPVQFYLNNDPRTNLFNINSNCLAIERKCKEITSNIQNNDYAVIGEKKSFLRISNYIEYDSFRNEKLFAFFYVWRDFFMDPIEVTPERVKGYERHDMSHFWNWLSDLLLFLLLIQDRNVNLINVKY